MYAEKHCWTHAHLQQPVYMTALDERYESYDRSDSDNGPLSLPRTAWPRPELSP